MGVLSRVGLLREETRRIPQRYAATIAFATGIVAVISVVVVRLSGADVHVGVTDAIAVGLTAVVVAEVVRFWIHRLSASTRTNKPAGLNDTDEPDAFAAYHSIVVRVWGALDGPDSFARLLSTLLSELADDLLLRRRGIVRSSRPDRARELLGDEVWAALTQPASLDTLDIDLVERVVDRLEEL